MKRRKIESVQEKSKRVIEPILSKKTFSDVAGLDNEIKQIADIVHYFKHPELFVDNGYKLPKGIIITGNPGVGKTLIAKALSGETQTPFYNITNSDLARDRSPSISLAEYFEEARKNAPSIIFIDELDKYVPRHMHPDFPGVSDFVNELLVQLDGFEENQDVLLIATANHQETLQKALIRPGRIDRHIHINMPDGKSRLDILQLHSKNKPIGEIDLERIAEITSASTGAQLEQIMNEAHRIMLLSGSPTIEQNHLLEAHEKITVGNTTVNTLTDEKKHRVSIHEIGHLLVNHFLGHSRNVYSASIRQNNDSVGRIHTYQSEGGELLTATEVKNEVSILLAGAEAEKLVFGELSTGIKDDLDRASELIQSQLIVLDTNRYSPLLNDHSILEMFTQIIPHWDDKRKIELILEDCARHSNEVLSEHLDLLNEMANQLTEKETLEQEEINSILNNYELDLLEKKCMTSLSYEIAIEVPNLN